MRYFSDTNDTGDTSNTAKSSDAIKTSASVTRLLSCLAWKSSLKNSAEASAASKRFSYWFTNTSNQNSRSGYVASHQRNITFFQSVNSLPTFGGLNAWHGLMWNIFISLLIQPESYITFIIIILAFGCQHHHMILTLSYDVFDQANNLFTETMYIILAFCRHPPYKMIDISCKWRSGWWITLGQSVPAFSFVGKYFLGQGPTLWAAGPNMLLLIYNTKKPFTAVQ